MEINNIFKNKLIYELFDEYDSIKGMDIDDDNEIKRINDKKSEEILNKIKFIQNELMNSSQINIGGLALNIQQLLNKRNINLEEDNKNNEENKFSEYNDIKENLFNSILSKEEINKDKNNTNELIKMDNPLEKNKMELEPLFPPQKKEPEQNLNKKEKDEKKEEQFTGKKRTRERKKKEKDIDKDDNNKKKNKRKKVNNKENENNNINNTYKEKGLKKGKEENLKKQKSKKDTKQNNKNSKTNNIRSLLNNSKTENSTKKNSNTRKTKKKESPSNSKRNKKPQRKPEDTRQSNRLIEEILKREFELGNKLKQKELNNKTKQINSEQDKENKENKEKAANNDNNINNTNINSNINNSILKPRYPKMKKKGKKRYNVPLIIDEELKKSTPIRNLKKQPKSILKKITTNPLSLDKSITPIKFPKARSSEKKINLSSESKNKKFKTFAEIFQSPSKLKATPLKVRRVNSEKKSNIKMNSILNAEEKSEKKELNNKKRNISFNEERIVKEYNPKTPVRDVKQRITRKSPLERKNRNELIK